MPQPYGRSSDGSVLRPRGWCGSASTPPPACASRLPSRTNGLRAASTTSTVASLLTVGLLTRICVVSSPVPACPRCHSTAHVEEEEQSGSSQRWYICLRCQQPFRPAPSPQK